MSLGTYKNKCQMNARALANNTSHYGNGRREASCLAVTEAGKYMQEAPQSGVVDTRNTDVLDCMLFDV